MTYLAVFISLVYLLNGCKSSEVKPSHAQGPKKDSVSQADTLPSISPPDPGLPPGQAELQAKVIKLQFNQADSTTHLSFIVNNVKEYGPSTPPIPTNDTLSIFIPTNLLQTVAEDDLIQITLQHNVSLTGKANRSEWSYIDIKN